MQPLTDFINLLVCSVGFYIFQRKGRQPPDRDAPETAWKMKEIGPRGGGGRPSAPLDSPLLNESKVGFDNRGCVRLHLFS